MQRSVLGPLAGLAMIAFSLNAQPASQPDAPPQACTPQTLTRTTNAALAHWRAWAAIAPDLQAAVDAGFNGREPAWSPDEQACAQLAIHRSAVEGLVDAASIASCDFGVDQSTGVRRSLPHVAKMRDASRLLVADCRRLMDSGQHEPAGARALALLRLSQHLNADLSSSSSLSAQGFAIMACDELSRLSERPDDLRALAASAPGAGLLELLRTLDAASDPFALEPAIAHEGLLLRCWVARTFPGEHAGRDMLASVELLGLPQELHEQISAMDSSALQASSARCAEFFADASKLILGPDAPSRLAALEERVLAGEFGPLAPIFAPRLSVAAPSREQSKEALARAIQLLAAALEPAANQPGAGSSAPK